MDDSCVEALNPVAHRLTVFQGNGRGGRLEFDEIDRGPGNDLVDLVWIEQTLIPDVVRHRTWTRCGGTTPQPFDTAQTWPRSCLNQHDQAQTPAGQ